MCDNEDYQEYYDEALFMFSQVSTRRLETFLELPEIYNTIPVSCDSDQQLKTETTIQESTTMLQTYSEVF
jgi:hypothetical protein